MALQRTPQAYSPPSPAKLHLWQSTAVQDLFWIGLAVSAVWFGYSAVTSQERPPQSGIEAWGQARDMATTVLVVETFFWLLLLSLVLVIFLRYVI